MGSGAWRERLQVIMDFPKRETVEHFINHTVQAACQDFADELQKTGVLASVKQERSGYVILTVHHGDEVDFTYKVKSVAYVQPSFAQQIADVEQANETQKYYRAEVHLREGGQDYDIMAWSKEGVINDIVQQYHTHMHFLHRLR